MAKKSNEKNRAQGTLGGSLVRTIPNWPLLGLALIGMGLTVYLTVSTLFGQEVAGCTVGSDCDVVLNSRWATLFGLPTSLWGFLAYASLAGIAFIKRPDLHAKLAWSVALFGVFYSLYLAFISFTQLQAACPYCLTSLSLLLAILGLVSYQWPRSLPHFSWPRWALMTVSGGLILVLELLDLLRQTFCFETNMPAREENLLGLIAVNRMARNVLRNGCVSADGGVF